MIIEPNRTQSKFDWVRLLIFFVCSITEPYRSINKTFDMVRVVTSGTSDLQPSQEGHSVVMSLKTLKSRSSIINRSLHNSFIAKIVLN